MPLLMRHTRARAAPRYDVEPHLDKWWSKAVKQDGLVEKHLSPMEQLTVEPYFWGWGGKKAKQFMDSVFDVGPALAFLVGTVYWSDWKFAQLSHHHRD